MKNNNKFYAKKSSRSEKRERERELNEIHSFSKSIFFDSMLKLEKKEKKK